MLSRISYIISSLLLLYVSLIFYPKWEQKAGESVLGWDVSGYYWYLPSMFIYKDLKQQKFGDSIIAKYEPTPAFEQSYVHESGNRVMVYSSGMALMYLPFFTVAHLVAEPLGHEPDGFTMPYQFSILIGSLLIAILGLWYLRRLLLYYYDDKVVAAVLFLLVFGTNYLNYTAIDGALTHNWLFTIYVFILLATRKFYSSPSAKYAGILGLLLGLAILIRPSEMIAILIPLLWGMERISAGEIKKKITFLLQQWKNIAITAVCACAVGSIQIIYWLYVTGKPIVYSYGDKGFSWKHPHWKDYMLSYQSGWLTYTPLAILFFIGILPFLFHGKNKVAVLTFFAINLYIVCAWDVWWYGGTGGRAMLQSYPILLFPFASLIKYLLNRKYLAIAATPAILLMAYFNIWFTYNAHAGQGLYDATGMTKEYFWRVIYRYEVPSEIYKLKDTDELFEGTPKDMTPVYTNNFENDTSRLPADVSPINGANSYMLYPRSAGSIYSIPLQQNSKWFRAEATMRCMEQEWTAWRMPQFVIRFTNGQDKVKERIIRIHRLISNGETKNIHFDTKIPTQTFDTVRILFWGGESTVPLIIDDLKLSTFNE